MTYGTTYAMTTDERGGDDGGGTGPPPHRLEREARERAGGVTLRDVRRAIVLDFEGEGWSRKTRVAPPPALLGAIVPRGEDPPEYIAYALEPALEILTRTVRGEWRHARSVSLEEALADVLRRATLGPGRMVTWFSRREAAVIGPVLDRAEALRPLRDRCFDAKAVMDSARGVLGTPKEEGGRSLGYYARQFSAAEELREQEALGVEPAAVLQELEVECRRVRRLRRIPQDVRERADDLLEYNRLDCEITRTCAIEAWRRRHAAKGRKRRSSGGRTS